MRTDAYDERQERVWYAETSAALTVLKHEPGTAWRNEVSSVPPQQALRHLDRAFRNCFAGHAKYPAFHNKHGAQAAEYTPSAFRWEADIQAMTLVKVDAPLPIRWSRPLPDGAQPSTMTVTCDTAGRHFVSILVEEEIAPCHPRRCLRWAWNWGAQGGGPASRRDAKRLDKIQRRLAKKRLGATNRANARRRGRASMPAVRIVAAISCTHARYA